jgi:hypothetical protein
MKGWMYRRAEGIKESGERLKLRFLIVLGLAIRNFILDISTVEDFICKGAK